MMQRNGNKLSSSVYNVMATECVLSVYPSYQTSLSLEQLSPFSRGRRSGAHIWLISGCLQSFFAWDDGVQFTNKSFC